jgi:hypothetical protein
VSQDASRIGKLILVPAVITLAVTLLRLVGELQGWSPILFNRGDKPFSPSLVGIVCLIPVLGGPDADGGVRELQQMLPPVVAC